MTFTKELLIDKKQQLWACNSLGLAFVNQNNQVEIINTEKGLPFDALNCIYEDQNGTYWIGSDGKGLFRFAGTHIKYYNARNGIQSDLITATLQFQNMMIFGSYDEGLIYYQNKKFAQRNLPNNTIWAAVFDAWNHLWVGSQNGLFKINGTVSDFARDIKISSFYKESKQIIWVGSSTGLHKIVNGNFIQNNDTTYENGTVRSILKYNESLICGTDGGLFRYKNGIYKNILSFKKRVSSLKIDQQNKLWIGSEDGLYVFDGQQIKQFKLANQPAARFINFINYKENQLFVGTNNGIYLIHTISRKVKHIGIDEGLVNLETNINSSYFDQKGNFWFGTAEGLCELELNGIETKLNDAKPFLNIAGIKINYETLNEKNTSKNQMSRNLNFLIYHTTKIILQLT
jgi:ligand-binding sensor domain-containing protein